MRKFVKKASLIFILLMIISVSFLVTSCRKPSRTEEIELPKNDVDRTPAWEALIEGYNKTAGAVSYDVVFKSYKEATYGEHSSTENLEHTMKITGLNTEDFTATAQKKNLTAGTTSDFFFLPEKFCSKEISNTNEITNRLFVSDDIDVLKEVTGLGVFKMDPLSIKAAVADSKSIKKGKKDGLSYTRFELSAEEMTGIMGNSFEVVPGMDEFTGFMYFYMDENGFLVKFGYDSHYSAVFDGDESHITRNVEYTFSNINSVNKVERPDWVRDLTNDKIASVKYTKNKVDYIFLYEAISDSDKYGYKLYEIVNSEDPEAKINLAEVPGEINGITVFEISGTAISFGKGVETLVLPEHITVVPYPEVSTHMTVFCHCSELSEPAISGTTVFLAGEWKYVEGVPTIDLK